MEHNRKRKGRRGRFLSILLVVVMVLSLVLENVLTYSAYAEEADTGLCEHHTEHTDKCGYIASTEDDPGQPCGYECKICPIEELIDALPSQVTEDNQDAVAEQLEEILSLYRELYEEEQEQIDLTLCLLLQAELDEANVPEQVDGAAVSYLDENGNTASCTNYTEITDQTTLSDGWYVVKSDVTISDRITVSGNVHLILTDGVKLTASAGINVADGSSFTVYAQSVSDSMGELTAKGGENNAGIGGEERSVVGAITINGGTVTADGGSHGAGIGGGKYGESGTITINGGTVTTTGGNYGAGIGSGYQGDSGTIIISGGTVTADGGSNGAGIGGGYYRDGGTIIISEGTVTAHGGSNAAGIGGGFDANGGTITINGGTVATTGGNYGAGIGGGNGGSGGTVTIEGGAVTAIGGEMAAGIGGGYYKDGGTVTINGGSVVAKSGKYCDNAVGAGFRKSGNGTLKISNTEKGISVLAGKSKGSAEWLDDSPFMEEQNIIDSVAGNAYVKIIEGVPPVSYLDETGGKQICEDYTFLTDQTTLSDGWYVMKNDVTIGDRITVNGDVHLILVDEKTLTASTGITVAEGNSLTIYAQSDGDGMGALIATGSSSQAGIGGENVGAGGTITINGGAVTATGGTNGAGIGGGSHGAGGTVTISGGKVTATGGTNGAGIGDGYNYSGTVTGTFSTTENGNAFIIATSITDNEDTGGWSGIIFQGSEGLVYKKPVLTESAEIPTDNTLTIPSGTSLTVNAVLTNNGTLTVDGGTLSGTSSLNGDGSFLTTELTEDMIHVPTDFSYDGTDWTDYIRQNTTLGTKTYCEKAFTVTGWTLSVTKKSDLEYAVTYTRNSEAVTKIVTVTKAALPEITLAAESTTYNGEVQKPNISNSDLEEGTDYEVIYTRDGIETDDFISAGKIKITVTGKGGYEGTKEVTYTIEKAVPEIIWSAPSQKLFYSGEAAEITAPTVTLAGSDTFSGTITYSDAESGKSYGVLPAEVGTYKIKASIAASENYTAAETENSLTLTIAYLNESEVAVKFNGSELNDGCWFSSATEVTVSADGFSIAAVAAGGEYPVDEAYKEEIVMAAKDVADMTFYFKQDETGYMTDGIQYTLNIDDNPPGGSIQLKYKFWDSFLTIISFGHYKATEKAVTIAAEDSESDIKTIEYIIVTGGTSYSSKEELEAAGLSWQAYNSGNKPTVSVSTQSVIYARLTDNVGNVTYLSSDGILLDETAPAISNFYIVEDSVTDEQAQASVTVDEAATIYLVAVPTTAAGSVNAKNVIFTCDEDAIGAEDGSNISNAVWSGTLEAGGDNLMGTVEITKLVPSTAYTIYAVAVDKVIDMDNTESGDEPVYMGNVSAVSSISFSTKNPRPVITTNPKVSGIYGQSIGEMTLADGVAADKDGAVLTGTWTVSESGQSEKPSVGTTEEITVTFTPDSEAYESISVTITPTVSPRSLSAKGVTVSDVQGTYVYTGSEFKPAVAVGSGTPSEGIHISDSGAALTVNDFTVTYNSNTNAGTATVTITGQGNYTGSVTKEFTIKKADDPPNKPGDKISAAYSCENVGSVKLPDGWEWSNSDKGTELEVGVTVSAAVCYAGTDKDNYNNITVTVEITRSSCEHLHTKIRDAVAATCTSAGYTGDTVCSDCKTVIKAGTKTGKLQHNYRSEVTKKPTTGSKGVRTYTCANCGDSYTKAIPKLPEPEHEHSYTSTVTKAATCTENGIRTYTCSCGDSYTEAISKLNNTGKPFIKGEEGKKGWNVIRGEEEKAAEGSVINVDMNGTVVVPGSIFDSIRGRDITVTFDMGNGIIWSVDGMSVTTDKAGDIDFSVQKETDSIPVDIINNVTGENYSIQISIAHEGEFGFTAVLSINLGKENAGYTASLYYYDKGTGELEFICSDTISEDGTASLAFTHASDYVIVVDKVSDSAQPETLDDDNSPETVENLPAAQAWRSWWIIAIGILVIIVGIGLFFVVKRKGKEDEE